MCVYHLVKVGERFKREQRIPLWFYLIIFIPAHLLQALCCMWDGGLREFEWQGRFLGYDTLMRESESWKKAKEIYERG